MMKTRLATNIGVYPFRLALLFEYGYSDGADQNYANEME